MKTLKVTSDKTVYEVAINPVWCDIGSHKVSEDRIISKYEVAICEDCHSHYYDKWN